MRETSEENRIKIRLARIESQLSLIKKLLIIQIILWLIGLYGFSGIFETVHMMIIVSIVLCITVGLVWLLLMVLERMMIRKGSLGSSNGDMQRILDQFESAKGDKSPDDGH